MNRRVALAFGAVLVIAGITWIMIPPFPAPMGLLDDYLTSLTAQLGPGNVVILDVPASIRSARTVEWRKSRVLAV